MVLEKSVEAHQLCGDLRPCSYCVLAKAKAKAKRSCLREPTNNPVFTDVQYPLADPLPYGNEIGIGIIEAKTRYIWMTITISKEVDGLFANAAWTKVITV